MSIPIIYKSCEYISKKKHSFITLLEPIQKNNISICNVLILDNNNIGIGTTFPINSLHVQNTSYFDGNIGIGTITPISKLHIFNNDLILSDRLGIQTQNPLQSFHIYNTSCFIGNIGVGTLVPLQSLHIEPMCYFKGNIGIGTTIPKSLLHINGNIDSPIFVGQISYFATSTPPFGWLKCNGATISRNSYSRLFNVINTTFGVGDNTTTFRIPDLRGEFLRGCDNNRGIDINRVFGSYQDHSILNHTHSGTAIGNATTSGSHTHSYTSRQQAVSNPINGGYGGNWFGTATVNTSSISDHTHTFTINITTNNPDANGTNETRPRNVALLACIKY